MTLFTRERPVRMSTRKSGSNILPELVSRFVGLRQYAASTNVKKLNKCATQGGFNGCPAGRRFVRIQHTAVAKTTGGKLDHVMYVPVFDRTRRFVGNQQYVALTNATGENAQTTH